MTVQRPARPPTERTEAMKHHGPAQLKGASRSDQDALMGPSADRSRDVVRVLHPLEYQKIAARLAVKFAVIRGALAKPTTCQECGLAYPPPMIHAHHVDYGDPLLVVWLCPKCHGGQHGRLRYPRCSA